MCAVTEPEDVSGCLCLKLVRTCREPSKGIVRVGWKSSPTCGKEDLEVFGPIEDPKQAAEHLRKAMKENFKPSTSSPGMSGACHFFGELQDIVEFFHMFCYHRLQNEHMPWMEIPMELD